MGKNSLYCFQSWGGINIKFRMVLSTMVLLNLCKYAKWVQLDSTYKLVWQHYSFHLVGFSDLARHFHPLCLSIFVDEKAQDYEFVLEKNGNALFILSSFKTGFVRNFASEARRSMMYT
jgi:hypothetical protein